MLEMDLWRFEDDPDRVAQLESLINDAKTISEQSNRAALEFLMHAVRLRPLVTRNESYYRLALNYSLALVYAHLDEPAAAAEHLERSGILPFDGGDLIFSEAQGRGLDLAEEQEASLERQAPTVFLASMPRAASAALTSTISEQFQCPIMRASVGRFPNYYLMPFWVRRLSRGGCVLHDHFGAQEFNQTTLSNCGIRTVFVLIRDPRASAVSYVQFINGHRGLAVSEEQIQRVFENSYMRWLHEWEEYAATSGSVEVIWLRSGDVTAGQEKLRAVMEKIIRSLVRWVPGWQPPGLSNLSLADANFVSGTSDGWKGFVSKSGQERMWSRIPAHFREMLELEP
jgi:hypothetical protein